MILGIYTVPVIYINNLSQSFLDSLLRNLNDYCTFCLAQICYVLYPGDELVEGKTLRLKQQYTLCSASLQDIIARFERRSGKSVNWEKLPEKVAVQMNDTHPTLCIPELIRILMDIKNLSWEKAWNITKRYFVSMLLLQA